MLTLSNITHHFGPTRALDDVSFNVAAGEVHALLGENGAGKSTLMRVAHGLLVPQAGEVQVDGHPVRTPRDARRRGLGMVHQHFTSVPAFTVAENIALAAGWSGSRRDLERRAAAEVTRLGFALDVTAATATLSVQLRQRLEIVQALASHARVLLLDEPTAVLAPREVATLLTWIRGFADAGGAVALITHKLREVTGVADRVTVLRRGQVVLSDRAAAHDEATLARAMLGAATATTPRAGAPPVPGEVVVQVGSIALRRGDVVGVAAVEGNGQRELLRTIAGVEATRHDVTVHGSVGFIPEDRSTEALIPELTLTENYLLGQYPGAPRWLAWDAVAARTAALLDRHQVKADGPRALAGSLSGGNQQRFILGRTLEQAPAVLVAEDPTRGLDLGATAELHRRLREAAQLGACVVVHASDLDELLGIADRILVVQAGVVRELPVTSSRDAVGDAMLGLA